MRPFFTRKGILMSINLTPLEQLVNHYVNGECMTHREAATAITENHGDELMEMTTNVNFKGRVSKKTVKDAAARIRKKVSMGDSNDGLFRVADEMGLNTGNVDMAWIKSKEGSFRVNMKNQDDEEAENNFLEKISEAFADGTISRAAPIIPFNNYTLMDDELLTKYVIADVHLGLYVNALECGEEYNLEVAEKVVFDGMKALVDSSPMSKECIVLSIGDYFHANDSKNMTPGSGHILDMAGRFHEIAVAGVRLFRMMVEYAAQKHDVVRVVSIPGNHDKDQAHWLSIAMGERFSESDRIKVHMTPGRWFKHVHGQNMFVAHHGDTANFNRMALAIPEMFRDEWGKTTWCFLDSGHVHHEQAKEIGGILCRSYRSPAAKDDYAVSSAYVSKRSMVSHVYHKDCGEIESHNINIVKNRVLKP